MRSGLAGLAQGTVVSTLMIPAGKNPFWDKLLYWYLRRCLRRYFCSVEVRGLEHLQNLDPERPVIAFANHTNWWDGLVVFYLSRFVRGKDCYCMMEERQLRYYPFFRWLGAFSVDLNSPIRAAGTIRYACALLKNPRSMLWIFPQGRMTNAHEKIEVRHGTHYMAARSGNACLLPVAFHYEFFREQKPRILMRFGAPFDAGDSSDEKIRKTLQTEVDGLARDSRKGVLEKYQPILKPSLSVNKKWEFVLLHLQGKGGEFKPAN